MKRLIAILLSTAVLAMIGMAQPATPAQRAGAVEDGTFGTLHFQTHLGSCRIIDGRGRVEMDFTGTILLSNVKGKYSVTGNVRKEYDNHDRVIYTGKGHVLVLGTWRAVHWFGKDMHAVWWGRGMIRLSGEFDREQKTGEFWFEDPSKISYWPGGNSIDVPVPPVTPGFNPNLKVKKKG